MAIRRISDLSELFVNYPDANMDKCLLEVSYNNTGRRYQSFYVKAANMFSHYLSDLNINGICTLTTSQTISGTKTFSNGFTLNDNNNSTTVVQKVATNGDDIATPSSNVITTTKAVKEYIDNQKFLKAVGFDDPTEAIDKINGLLNDKNLVIGVHSNSSLTYRDENGNKNWKFLTIGNTLGITSKTSTGNTWQAVKTIYDAISIAQSIKFLGTAICYICIMDDQQLSKNDSTGILNTVIIAHPDLVQNKWFDIRGVQPASRESYLSFTSIGTLTQRKIYTPSKVNDISLMGNYYKSVFQLHSRVIFRYIDFDGMLIDNDFLQTDSDGNFVTWELATSYTSNWLRNLSTEEITIKHCTFTGIDYACVGSGFNLESTSFCNVSLPVYCLGGRTVSIQNSVNVLKCNKFVRCDQAGYTLFSTTAKQFTRIQTVNYPFICAPGSSCRVSFCEAAGTSDSIINVSSAWRCEIQKKTGKNDNDFTIMKIGASAGQVSEENYVKWLIGNNITKTNSNTYINTTNGASIQFSYYNSTWLASLTNARLEFTFKDGTEYPKQDIAQCPPTVAEIEQAQSTH